MSSRGLREGGVEPAHRESLVLGDDRGRKWRAFNQLVDSHGGGREGVPVVSAGFTSRSRNHEFGKEATHETVGKRVQVVTAPATDEKLSGIVYLPSDHWHAVGLSEFGRSSTESTQMLTVEARQTQNKDRWTVGSKRAVQAQVK